MELHKKASIDESALREKIAAEANFISGLMNKVPSFIWQEESDDSEEDDETDSLAVKEDSHVIEGAEASVQSQISECEEKNTCGGKPDSGIQPSLSKKYALKVDKSKREKKEPKCPLLPKYNKQYEPPEQQKAGFSSEGKMVFSKFDFSEMGSYIEGKKKKVCNDPKKILEKLNQRHELIQKLKSEGQEERALKLKEKDGWNKAFYRVQGINVRDDPQRLKEAIYKKELAKNKHKQRWEKREEKVKKEMEYRIIKRETNLKAHRELKMKHKLKKALKKGRVIPGFS